MTALDVKESLDDIGRCVTAQSVADWAEVAEGRIGGSVRSTFPRPLSIDRFADSAAWQAGVTPEDIRGSVRTTSGTSELPLVVM